MQHSIQASNNKITFRRPTFQIEWNKFWERVWIQLERNGRVRAARYLHMHGYTDQAKIILKDMP